MFPILFRRIRKSLFVFLPLALLASYAVHDVLSHYRGLAYCAVPLFQQDGCNSGASPSDGCHGATTTAGTMIHIYPTQVFAGSTDTMHISVTNGYPLDVAGAFDIDVDTPASLDTIPGNNTFLTAALGFGVFGTWSDITQTAPRSFSIDGGDSAVWTFVYIAPSAPGIDTIYADGMAVIGDSANPSIHDYWNQLSQPITVLPAPSLVTPASFSNTVQIYPNPASNQVFINDGIPTDVGTYTFTDASGHVVLYGRQIPLDGSRSIDISTIASGAYFLNVQPRMGRALTRSIVIAK